MAGRLAQVPQGLGVMSLVEAFDSVPDPRQARGKRHPLPAVLAMLSAAMLCGCRSLYAAAQWGSDHEELARDLGLSRHGAPSIGMLHNLLKRLDVAAFEAALRRWAGSLAEALGESDPDHLEPVAIDGKTLCGSHGQALPGVHLLAAWAVRLGLVLNQVPAGNNKHEGGEITAAPELLRGLALRGKLITADAIHCQRELCRQIVDGGGEYLIAVGENQPKLHNEGVDGVRNPHPDSPLLPTPM